MATSLKFVTDLFTSATEHLSFESVQEAAEAIVSNGFLPDSIYECEESGYCFDRTEDVAQIVRDLDPDYRQNYRLFCWLQMHGAVSAHERAA